MYYLEKITDVLERVINRASYITCSIALVGMVSMMLLTFIDVSGRSLFNKPIIGAYEITQVLVAATVALALAYTGVQKKHISIDMFIARLPVGAQKIIIVIADLLSFIMLALITICAVAQARNLYSQGETTAALGIKLFPFVWALAFGCAMLSLVYLVDFLRSLIKAVKH
jgi:TRAP-type C4-dicarboxylate transport system permease small subunit